MSSRETIARIIDPMAFDTVRYRHRKNEAAWSLNKASRRDAALSKAATILAPSEGKSATEGEVERLRYFSAALRDHHARTEDLKVLAHDCEVHAEDIDAMLAASPTGEDR